MKKISSIITSFSLALCTLGSDLNVKCCQLEGDELKSAVTENSKDSEKQGENSGTNVPSRTNSSPRSEKDQITEFDFLNRVSIKTFMGKQYSKTEIKRISDALSKRKSSLTPVQVLNFLSKARYEKNRILRLLNCSDACYYLWEYFKLPYDYIHSAIYEKNLTVDEIKMLKKQRVNIDLFKSFLCSKDLCFDEFFKKLELWNEKNVKEWGMLNFKNICQSNFTNETIKRLIQLNLNKDQITTLIKRDFTDRDINLILDKNIIDFNLALDTKISNKNIISYISSDALIRSLINKIMEVSGLNEQEAEKLLFAYNEFIFTKIPDNLFTQFLQLDVNDFSYVICTLKAVPSIIECLKSEMDSKKLVYSVYFLEAAYKNLNRDIESCYKLSLDIQDELYSKIIEQMSPYDMMIRQDLIRRIYCKEHVKLKNKFFTKSVSSWRETPVNMSESDIRNAIKEIAPESHFDEYLFEKSKYDDMSRYEGIGFDYQKLLQRILLLKDEIISNKECHDFILGQFYNQDSEACKNRLINIIYLCAKTIDYYYQKSNFISKILTNYRLDLVEKIFTEKYLGYENFYEAFNNASFGAENMIAYRQALEMPFAIPLSSLSPSTEDDILGISLDQDFIIMALSENYFKTPLKEYFKNALNDDKVMKQALSFFKISIRDYFRMFRNKTSDFYLKRADILIKTAEEKNALDCFANGSEYVKNLKKIKKLKNLMSTDSEGMYTERLEIKKIAKLIAFLNDFLSNQVDVCKNSKDKEKKRIYLSESDMTDKITTLLENKKFKEIGFYYEEEDPSEYLDGCKELEINFLSSSVEQQMLDLFVNDKYEKKEIIKDVLTECFYKSLIDNEYISESCY